MVPRAHGKAAMPTPPKSTPEQRAAALAKAAEARRVRAEVKELLSTGSLRLADVFERAESDDLVGGMKINSVLVSLPRLGKVKTKRLLEEHGVAENRRVRSLTDRQRRDLLDALS